MDSLGARIFYPVSSRDFSGGLAPGQRYRHGYGDLRRSKRADVVLERMAERQTAVVNRLGDHPSEKAVFYNFFNNDRVEVSELIDRSCRIAPSLTEGRGLLCLMDTSSLKLLSSPTKGKKAGLYPGVLDDNSTPGFFMHACLVQCEHSKHVLGLGDIVLFSRPKMELPPKDAQRARRLRARLPLEHKESYVWPLAAANASAKLKGASRLTYVLDQGGDKYEALARLRQDTGGADFIVRSKEDRLAVNLGTGQKGRLSSLLGQISWQGTRSVQIRGLDHYSKTNGKKMLRKARKAKLKIRFAQIRLCLPSSCAFEARLDCPLHVIEVMEDASTVPKGEKPVHWRLLTTCALDGLDAAWHIVECYESRWTIEELFRVFKKQGFDIEHTQFESPGAVKRQAVLALKASCQAMQLTQARDGKEPAQIEAVFPKPEQNRLLEILDKKLSGRTKKTTNSHQNGTLAWAAWIIARLGGWNGYQSGRPPGPVTMFRGLKRFDAVLWGHNLNRDP